MFAEALRPGEALSVVIYVDVDSDAPSSVVNEASVSGGAATEASASDRVPITSTPVSFGIERYSLAATNEDGSEETQGGSHPYELTAEVALNQALDSEANVTTAGSVKDLHFELPPGLIFDSIIFPQCTQAQFVEDECSNNAAIGVALTTVAGTVVPAAIYDLAPAPGEPARFGFTVDGVPLVIDIAVRTGGDYGLTASIDDIPNSIAFAATRLTFWGEPIDPSHDALRGHCAAGEETECLDEVSQTAFATLPSSCVGSPKATMLGDSWQEPDVSLSNSVDLPQLTGCNRLSFSPQVRVVPNTLSAGEPSGYNVQLDIPQGEWASSLATAEVESAKIALPDGVSLSSPALNSLTGCTEAQIALQSNAPGSCPGTSQIGWVSIETSLLAEPLRGHMYLAAQDANPFGVPVAIYLEAEDPATGVVVKLAGEVALSPLKGQPTLIFDHMPQLPLSDFELEFSGGSRALFVNPPTCGPAITTGELTPWSSGQESGCRRHSK